MKRLVGIAAGVSLAALVGAPCPGWAQPTGGSGVDEAASSEDPNEEIVVTAEKRSQSVQRVPSAITAIGEQAIKDARIERMLDLQRQTPSLTYSETNGNYQVSLRGLGNEFAHPSGESAIVTNVDGVYYARSTGLDSAFNDLARIEVLRGPQGTLYGRNATGGVLNLITRTPGEEFRGNLGLTYGSRDRMQAVGGVEGAIADNTNARLSFMYEDRDGDQRNILDGRSVNNLEALAFRGTVVTEAAPDLTITLRGDYYDDDIDRPYSDNIAEFPTGSPFGIVPSAPGGIFQSQLNLQPTVPLPNNGRDIAISRPDATYGNTVYGGSATIDWDVAESWSLKSITAYRRNEHRRFNFDVDGSSADILEEDFHFVNADQFTQEINISGTTTGDTTWIVGAYYYDERFKYDYSYTIDALAAVVERATELALGLEPGSLAGTVEPSFLFSGRQHAQSASVFGQITVPVTDDLKLTGGARYNWDKKQGTQSLAALGGSLCEDLESEETWEATTFRVGAEYEPQQGHLFYANVAKGFKAGGINVGACGNTFDPEEVVSYEIGTKNRFWGNRLTVNVDAFYYDYTNLQQNLYLGGGALIENAANATVYGIEIQAQVSLFDGFDLGAGLSWLSAEYDDFVSQDPLHLELGPQDFAGNSLPKAPEFSASVTPSYRFAIGSGEALLQYEYYYSDGWFSDPANNERARQPSYSLHNVRASYTIDEVELGVFADNITNEKYYVSLSPNGNAGGVSAVYGTRRRFGVFTRLEF